MNTNTYTPGPWSASRDAVPPGHTQITVYEERTGQRVATAFEREANAQLIAAAPELLNALEVAQATIERLHRHAPGSANGTLGLIKDAIAKATNP